MRRALGALRGAGGRAGDARAASGGRIAWQAVLQLVVRVLNVAIGVVTVALMARELGTEQFGAWSTALGYVGLFAFLNDFGFAQVGIQRMAEDPERESEWLGALAALRALGGVAALVLCVAGIPLFLDPEEDVRLVALVLSISVFAAVPYALMAVFTSRLRGGVALALLTFQSIVWLVAVVLVLEAGGGLLDLAWAFVAVGLLVGVVQVAVTGRYVRIAVRDGRRLWGGLFRVALPLGLAGLASTIYYRIDAVMVFDISGAQEAGYYGAAYRVLDPLHILPTAVMSAVFPVVAAVHAIDRERVGRLVQAALDYLAVVAVPIFAGSIVVAEPLMTAIFGDRFAPAADVLPLLMLGFVGVALGYLPGYLWPVVQLQWLFVALAAIAVVLNIGLNLVLIPAHGAIGAAIATVVTEFWIAAAGLVAVKRRLGVPLALGRVARACLAAGLMAIAAAAALELGLLAALAVAGPVYVAGLLLLRVVNAGQLRRLLGQKAG
jgi:O-antigen/teichoic acid export membrane protein